MTRLPYAPARALARRLWALPLALCAAALHAQASVAPLTADDLVRLQRLSDVQISPDGRRAALVVRETDMEANRGRTDLWLLDLRTPGATPARLAPHAANDSSPRWAPDGRSIYFLSSRSGSSQIWKVSVAGGEPHQVTSYPLDISAFRVSPAGDRLALAMDVFPECPTLACSRERLDAQEKSAARGRVFDQLFVRHWDTWRNGTRSHLFSAVVTADGTAAAPVDLSGALDGDVPSKPFGDDHDFTFSPDGKRLVFSLRVAGRTEPWSTNFDLFEVDAAGKGGPRNLTEDNPAWDALPVFLANGDLAWLAMSRPGFEADRYRVMLRSARTGATRALTQNWDRSPDGLYATPDGRQLLLTADDVGQHALFALTPRGGTPRKLVASGQTGNVSASASTVLYSLASLGGPADLYSIPLRGGEARRLTRLNAAVLDARTSAEYEQFSFKGWNDEEVYGYVMKPAGFDASRRYPVAFVIHGGPQASMANQWTYRWNSQVLAARGYGVVTIDFHGSPGYGQAFTDSISRDWGGKPLIDLQRGLAAALARYPWLDGDRACALGASYGGYMINWIAGQWPDRFRCLVNHDGIFDQRTMYYSTEELWFPEWENGAPYYAVPANYEKFNPANFVERWRTPMLVIHGGQDFRVPDSQGISTFTALQRRGIESRLLYFPDENHWVLAPANSVQWYGAVLDWLDEHLKD